MDPQVEPRSVKFNAILRMFFKKITISNDALNLKDFIIHTGEQIEMLFNF